MVATSTRVRGTFSWYQGEGGKKLTVVGSVLVAALLQSLATTALREKGGRLCTFLGVVRPEDEKSGDTDDTTEITIPSWLEEVAAPKKTKQTKKPHPVDSLLNIGREVAVDDTDGETVRRRLEDFWTVSDVSYQTTCGCGVRVSVTIPGSHSTPLRVGQGCASDSINAKKVHICTVCREEAQVVRAARKHGALLWLDTGRFDSTGKLVNVNCAPALTIDVTEATPENPTGEQVKYRLVSSIMAYKDGYTAQVPIDDDWVAFATGGINVLNRSPCARANKKQFLMLYCREGSKEDIEAIVNRLTPLTDKECEEALPSAEPLQKPQLKMVFETKRVPVFSGDDDYSVIVYDSAARTLPVVMSDMAKVYGIKFSLRRNWIQRDRHSCGYYALAAALSHAKGETPTPPTNKDSEAILKAITDEDIRHSIGTNLRGTALQLEVQRVREQISVYQRSLSKKTPLEELILADRISNTICAAATRMITRVTGVPVQFSGASSFASVSQTRVKWAEAPIKVFFGTEHFFCCVAARTEDVTAVQKTTAKPTLYETMLQKRAELQAVKKQQMQEVDQLKCFVEKDNLWTCKVCSSVVQELEKSEPEWNLRYGKGLVSSFTKDGITRHYPSTLRSNQLSHLTSGTHAKALQIAKERSTSTAPREVLPKKLAKHWTDSQERSVFSLVVAVLRAVRCSVGLENALGFMDDMSLVGGHTLDSHRSRTILEEVRTLAANTLTAQHLGEVRRTKRCCLKLDASPVGTEETVNVYLRCISPQGKVKDYFLGLMNLDESNADGYLKHLQVLLDRRSLTSWFRESVIGFSTDSASTMKRLRLDIEEWIGRRILSLHDAAHILNRAAVQIKKERGLCTFRKNLNRYCTLFRKKPRLFRKLRQLDHSALTFDKEVQIRWSAYTAARMKAARRNLRGAITVLEEDMVTRGDTDYRSMVSMLQSADFQHRLAVASDIFDSLACGSKMLQEDCLTLAGMNRVCVQMTRDMKRVGKRGGAQEKQYLVENDAVMGVQKWRSKLCRAVRVDLLSRMESFEDKEFLGILQSAEWGKKTDTSRDAILAFATKYCNITDEDSLYEICEEWRGLQGRHDGGNPLDTILEYVTTNETNPLSHVLEALVCCHPSSVSCERCFSLIAGIRGKTRTRMTTQHIEEELVVKVLCPTQLDEKRAFALEVTRAFLCAKVRRWKVRNAGGSEGAVKDDVMIEWKDLMECDGSDWKSEDSMSDFSDVSDLSYVDLASVDDMSDDSDEEAVKKAMTRISGKRKRETGPLDQFVRSTKRRTDSVTVSVSDSNETNVESGPGSVFTETDRPEALRAKSIVDGAAVLKETIDSLRGWQLHVVDGNGNCQFAALAQQCLSYFSRDEAAAHDKLRGDVVNHLVRHEELLSFAAEDKSHFSDNPASTVADYVASMSQDRTYGDHITLQACAELLKVDIWLLDASKPTCFELHAKFNGNTQTSVVLAFCVNHYDVVSVPNRVATLLNARRQQGILYLADLDQDADMSGLSSISPVECDVTAHARPVSSTEAPVPPVAAPKFDFFKASQLNQKKEDQKRKGQQQKKSGC